MFSFFNSTSRRVRRGVQVLEAYDPEWYNKINLDTFTISSGSRCAVAQVTGIGYTMGLDRLGLPDHEGDRYGFMGFTPGAEDELDSEWRHVITLKQQQHLESLLTDNATV